MQVILSTSVLRRIMKCANISYGASYVFSVLGSRLHGLVIIFADIDNLVHYAAALGSDLHRDGDHLILIPGLETFCLLLVQVLLEDIWCIYRAVSESSVRNTVAVYVV